MAKPFKNHITTNELYIVLNPQTILYFRHVGEVVEHFHVDHTPSKLFFRHNGRDMAFQSPRAQWAITMSGAVAAADAWRDRAKAKLRAKMAELDIRPRIFQAEEQ